MASLVYGERKKIGKKCVLWTLKSSFCCFAARLRLRCRPWQIGLAAIYKERAQKEAGYDLWCDYLLAIWSSPDGVASAVIGFGDKLKDLHALLVVGVDFDDFYSDPRSFSSDDEFVVVAQQHDPGFVGAHAKDLKDQIGSVQAHRLVERGNIALEHFAELIKKQRLRLAKGGEGCFVSRWNVALGFLGQRCYPQLIGVLHWITSYDSCLRIP